jgi:excisionase family DNA binding protein
MKRLMTSKDAALVLRCSVQKVRQLARDGVLRRVVSVSERRYLFHPDDIDALMGEEAYPLVLSSETASHAADVPAPSMTYGD